MQQLIAQLKRHEGAVRLPNGDHKLYRCPAGKQTLGYGRNVEDRGITEDEADYLLSNDIIIAQRELVAAFPWFQSLDDVRQAVLINMHFNLGIGRLRTFRNALAAMQIGDWDRAAVEMLDSRWAQQVGRRAVELAEQMRTGAWM
jgi:lysozyme